MTTTELANDLSKCSVKEDEKPQADRTSVVPSARFPVQVPPQNIQGMPFKMNLDVTDILEISLGSFCIEISEYISENLYQLHCYKISLIGHICETRHHKSLDSRTLSHSSIPFYSSSFPITLKKTVFVKVSANFSF